MNDHDFERLERYVDGALGEAEAAEIARLVAEDGVWQRSHARLAGVREALKARVAADVDRADFGPLWARIEAGLPRVAQPATAGERFRAWWARYWTPVFVSAAAAAGVAYFVVRATVPAEEAPGPGQVAVDAVQNGGNKTVLISQPAEGEDGATVIWLLEDERGETGGQAAPSGEDPI